MVANNNKIANNKQNKTNKHKTKQTNKQKDPNHCGEFTLLGAKLITTAHYSELTLSAATRYGVYAAGGNSLRWVYVAGGNSLR